jgi:transglutaminase-like putative cysteine protease
MRLAIHHETTYRYSLPVSHSIQLLRLTPRNEPHQRILSWKLSAPSRLSAVPDAFGNATHMLVLRQPHSEVKVVVTGTVEIDQPALSGALPRTAERLSPLTFLPATRLTQPSPEIEAFVAAHLPQPIARPAQLVALAEAIEDRVTYRPGVTQTWTTAAQALEAGYGVCQDHAHLFIACCRSRGTPARYVSGYVDPGDVEHAASHAWVDAWLPEQGWVSIDVTHRSLVVDRHCRLAVGRDYDSASPLRGLRIGGGQEALQVAVRVLADQ